MVMSPAKPRTPVSSPEWPNTPVPSESPQTPRAAPKPITPVPSGLSHQPATPVPPAAACGVAVDAGPAVARGFAQHPEGVAGGGAGAAVDADPLRGLGAAVDTDGAAGGGGRAARPRRSHPGWRSSPVTPQLSPVVAVALPDTPCPLGSGSSRPRRRRGRRGGRRCPHGRPVRAGALAVHAATPARSWRVDLTHTAICPRWHSRSRSSSSPRSTPPGPRRRRRRRGRPRRGTRAEAARAAVPPIAPARIARRVFGGRRVERHPCILRSVGGGAQAAINLRWTGASCADGGCSARVEGTEVNAVVRAACAVAALPTPSGTGSPPTPILAASGRVGVPAKALLASPKETR